MTKFFRGFALAATAAFLFMRPAIAQVGPGPLIATPAAPGVGTCFQGGNDQFTKILLHMDGANGGTSFPDTNAGGVSATWTASGPTTSTSGPKFGTAAYQGTSTGYIQSGVNSPYDAGSSDFTIDFWIKGTAPTTYQKIAGFGNFSLTNNLGWDVNYFGNGNLQFRFQNSGGGAGSTSVAASGIMDGNWHWVLLSKTSTALQIYLDGVATGTPGSVSGSMRTGSFNLRIGDAPDGVSTNRFLGQLDEFRYRINTIGSTTPPAQPYCPGAFCEIFFLIFFYQPWRRRLIG